MHFALRRDCTLRNAQKLALCDQAASARGAPISLRRCDTMSEWGHESGHPVGGCPKSANNRLMRRGKRHLYSITSSVRASSIGERSTPECLQSVEIDDQLKFVRKFDRQVTPLGTFEDLHDVGSRAPKVISEIDAIPD